VTESFYGKGDGKEFQQTVIKRNPSTKSIEEEFNFDGALLGGDARKKKGKRGVAITYQPLPALCRGRYFIKDPVRRVTEPKKNKRSPFIRG